MLRAPEIVRSIVYNISLCVMRWESCPSLLHLNLLLPGREEKGYAEADE